MSRSLRRREFLQASALAGIAVLVAPLGRAPRAALEESERLRPLAWDPAAGRPLERIDGVAKVTGEKLFANDFRARDLPGWPERQGHALLLRAAQADRPYLGFDLSALPAENRPDRSVTAGDLERHKLALPAFYGDEMLLAEGRTPAYLGHPVAILIWYDYLRYRRAKLWLRARGDVLHWGAPSGARVRDPWGGVRIVRVAGPAPDAPDVHSALEHGMLFPAGWRDGRPLWPTAAADGDAGARAMHHAQAIAAELASPPPGVQTFEREYVSQSTDTAALEPDNANGWYDPAARALHLVVASQSPHEVAQETAAMVARSSIPLASLRLHPCYTVGYGSKDHTPLPFYAAVAALFGDGVPVRLANDREEQFQSALKRHSFRMTYRVSVERDTGKFRAFSGALAGDGGGRANFSPDVALVAATAAQSLYAFPKNDIQSFAAASRAVDAGSARGYGTLQSMSAMELLVDEIAEALGVDPIELRLRNALHTGERNSQGAVPAGALRAVEVLERARAHPLWTQRQARKQAHEAQHPGERCGIGFACVQKDYGTGAEGAFAAVELSPRGEVELRHVAVEIGTGSSTAQALLCAQWFGRPAGRVRTAQTDWPELPMRTSGNPYAMAESEQARAAQDPLWTPALVTPTSASNSSYFYGHATREAARLVFERGLWPAALSMWGEGVGGGAAAPLVLRAEDARWVEGRLTAAGLAPLELAALAERAHARGLVTGAVVHTFNRWQWAEAEFEVGPGRARARLPLDGLALRRGTSWRVAPRRKVFLPPTQRNGAGVTYYSTAGTLVEVAVEMKTGAVRVLSHHTILECGRQLVGELVSGQIQGGVAMGIGHALYEELPLYEGGPGSGGWNFDRYHVPRASEVAVYGQTAEVLEPLSESDPPKGMGEVVAIPVIAAIGNAVAHALGRRLRELPLTPGRILEALA